MSSSQNSPQASRPHIPEYGIPTDTEGLLPWDFAVEQIQQARNYWIATVGLDGRPHSVPVWGVWVNQTFYHGGGQHTRWARNLDANPRIVVHLESGDRVVIVEGTAEKLTPENAAEDLLRQIDDAYEAKYGIRHGTPVWALRPQVAFGWTEYPTTVTRWQFDQGQDEA